MLAGFRTAALDDFNVLYKIILSSFVFVLAIIFHAWVDASLIIFATGTAISSELFNTALETLCDFVHPDYHQEVGKVKDIAAAAVGIISFVWLVVILIELVEMWPLFHAKFLH